jgi:hypothetical protein
MQALRFAFEAGKNDAISSSITAYLLMMQPHTFARSSCKKKEHGQGEAIAGMMRQGTDQLGGERQG